MEADEAGGVTIAYTAPQADLVQDRQKFVAEMDREPSPNAVDNKGVTDILHHAAALNLPALALSLLDQGAEIEAKAILHASISPHLTAFLNKMGEEDHEIGGCTPLHVAALTNSFETAETLLKNGADVHAEDDEGGMSLHYAMLANTSDTMQVLLDYGADVHAEDDDKGWVLLHMAALANASDTVQVLLANGADVHARDNDGLTPLHVAAGSNADKAAAVLLSNGADVHAKDNNGFTPLHWAAGKDAAETAKLLLDRGAKINAETTVFSGTTPLSIAEENNAHTTAEVLRRYGSHAAEMVETLPEQASLAKKRENEPDSQQDRALNWKEGLAAAGVALIGGLAAGAAQAAAEEERREEEKRRQEEARQAALEKRIGCGFIMAVGIVLFFIIRSC